MEEWKEYKLGEIIDFTSGGTPNKNTPKFWDGDIPWISAKTMYVDFVSTSDLFISQEGLEAGSKLAPKGTILLLTRGSGLFNTIPICKVVSPVAFNQDVKCLYSKNEGLISNDFLYYWLKGNEQTITNILETTGIGAGKIDTKRFLDLPIKLPSLQEQDKLVKIASSLFEKIKINNDINENLEQQAQALFKSWFVDFEPFRDQPFVESELGMIPQSLTIKRISELSHILETGRRPKGGVGELNQGIPSVGAEHVKGLGNYDYTKTKYITKEYANSLKTGKINGYELLIYKDGGKPGYFIPNYSIFGEGYPFDECYLNEHVFKLDFNNRGFNAFCYFYFHTDYVMHYLNSQGSKAAIPGINRQDIESIPIYSPENVIVNKYCDWVLPLIKTILTNSVESLRLSHLRDTLLPKLMSGEIKL